MQEKSPTYPLFFCLSKCIPFRTLTAFIFFHKDNSFTHFIFAMVSLYHKLVTLLLHFALFSAEILKNFSFSQKYFLYILYFHFYFICDTPRLCKKREQFRPRFSSFLFVFVSTHSAQFLVQSYYFISLLLHQKCAQYRRRWFGIFLSNLHSLGQYTAIR